MFFSSHTSFNAVTFFGAGLTMVAYGASTAVGLAEPSTLEATDTALSPVEPEAVAEGGIAQCLGRRLEVHLYQGC